MKAIIIVASILVVGAITAASVVPQETETEYFAGIVLGVDPFNRLLSVEEASADAKKMTFSVPVDAKVSKGDEAIELRAIRVGDPVSVEYKAGPREPVAVTVKVITSPAT